MVLACCAAFMEGFALEQQTLEMNCTPLSFWTLLSGVQCMLQRSAHSSEVVADTARKQSLPLSIERTLGTKLRQTCAHTQHVRLSFGLHSLCLFLTKATLRTRCRISTSRQLRCYKNLHKTPFLSAPRHPPPNLRESNISWPAPDRIRPSAPRPSLHLRPPLPR
jgi:hypothetical protein